MKELNWISKLKGLGNRRRRRWIMRNNKDRKVEIRVQMVTKNQTALLGFEGKQINYNRWPNLYLGFVYLVKQKI